MSADQPQDDLAAAVEEIRVEQRRHAEALDASLDRLQAAQNALHIQVAWHFIDEDPTGQRLATLPQQVAATLRSAQAARDAWHVARVAYAAYATESTTQIRAVLDRLRQQTQEGGQS